MGRFCVWNFALHTQLETLLPRQSDCSAYRLRTAKLLVSKSTYMLAKGRKADPVFGDLCCTSISRCFDKSTQPSKSPWSKYTNFCFQTTSTQQDLTRPPKSQRRRCEGTNTNTSRVHQLQSWLSWFAAANTFTEKAGREPTQSKKTRETQQEMWQIQLGHVTSKMGSGSLN